MALDSNHTARGKLYWDDGDVLDPAETKLHNLIKFEAEQVMVFLSCMYIVRKVKGQSHRGRYHGRVILYEL